MCGIAGVVAPNAGVYRGAVAAMLDAMSHRGPDGSGVWESPSGSCVLGHRRLAILDLSDNAAQPMVMPNRKFAISYNGECYDFSAIKESLVRDGDQFQSTGDTEVFLKLLARHGEGALAEVNAMFALAFWDEDRRTLLLARDRFGQKPLYWTQRDGVLVFASEVRALLASGLVDRTISQDGLAGFLCHGAVQDPLTIIKDVYSLPRGTSLTFRYGATKELKKFWEHNYTRCAATPADVREEVCQAVRRHLISDVPVGVFLSGGVDSSIIAAAASQSSVSNVKSLAVVFPDQRESCEAEYAKRASKISGTEHIEVPVSDSDMLEYVQQAVERFDQPSADGVNTFIVSGAARQAGLRVALSGLGGD